MTGTDALNLLLGVVRKGTLSCIKGHGNGVFLCPDGVECDCTIGCEHFIVATDSGQTQNPYWYESIKEYIDYLYDVGGFTKEEIDRMTKVNPGRMLGIC